jgi:hypothetical protein
MNLSYLNAVTSAFTAVAGNATATTALAGMLGSGKAAAQTGLSQINAYQMDMAVSPQNLVGAQMALSAIGSIQGLPAAVAPQLALLNNPAADASAKATAVAAIQTALNAVIASAF